jgi:hypothetical protein
MLRETLRDYYSWVDGETSGCLTQVICWGTVLIVISLFSALLSLLP